MRGIEEDIFYTRLACKFRTFTSGTVKKRSRFHYRKRDLVLSM